MVAPWILLHPAGTASLRNPAESAAESPEGARVPGRRCGRAAGAHVHCANPPGPVHPARSTPAHGDPPLLPITDQLAGRFRNRADTEHVQAAIRLAIAAAMAALLMALYPDAIHGETRESLFALAIGLELVLAVGILASIAVSPGISHTRRSVGIVGDIGTSCLAMSVLGIDAAPLWGVCLWVVVGNGLRFGPRYLLATMAAALVGFCAVILINDDWTEHPVLAWTLWGVLFTVPAYLHKLVRDLTEARDAAARASAAKTWFLASTSHELRTPLNGVVTAVELLRTTDLSREQQRLADTALQGARALSGLVGDILDISAIESGSLTLHATRTQPREIAKAVAMMLAPTAREKGIALDLEASADVPMEVELDAQRTQQALLNLAHNAVKFTDSGRVCIRVGVSEDSRWLLFEVSDTGIGIAPDVLPRIFDAFTQAETGAHRRYGGTGIGTTIARELVTRMGGRMYAESTLGVGSRFWFTVPLARAEGMPVSPMPAIPANAPGQLIAEHRRRFAPKRVIVLDDLASNREVLRTLLERLGHEVVEVDSAPAALDVLAGETVHAAVVDWHMPEITGHDLLLEIKASGGRAADVPVIILTADATSGTMARAMAAGAAAFLTKPISVPALLRALEGAFGGGARPAPDAPAVDPVPESDATLDLAHIDELLESGLTEATVAHLSYTGLADVRRAAQAARQAAQAGNLFAFADAAHAIKGVAANIGAPKLAAAAHRAMRADPVGFRASAGSDLLAELDAEIDLARRAVAARFPGAPGD